MLVGGCGEEVLKVESVVGWMLEEVSFVENVGQAGGEDGFESESERFLFFGFQENVRFFDEGGSTVVGERSIEGWLLGDLVGAFKELLEEVVLVFGGEIKWETVNF